MNKPTGKNILGFDCILYDNMYIYPRYKLDSKYIDLISDNMSLKYNKKWYCNINSIFKAIYANSYISHKPKIYQQIEKYVEIYSNIHRNELLQTSLNNKVQQLEQNYIPIHLSI